jgi:hypothetical protein
MGHLFARKAGCGVAAVLLAISWPLAATGRERPVPRQLAPPVENGPWIVPAPGKTSEPVWGVKGGMMVGLWPTGGPRGLLRIYTPYLGQPRGRMINFIAVEPVVSTARGLSELEPSGLDDVPGKAMWTGNTFDPAPQARNPWEPAGGKVGEVDGKPALRVFVFVEPFANGARPVLQLTFRADRPHEVSLKVFAARDSAPMKACVLTATMGNYARLRQLWLRGQVVDSRKAWPAFKPDQWGFASPRQWAADRMLVVGRDVVAAATPDEADPAGARYASDVPPWWRYEGKPATQYWRTRRTPETLVRVNGRQTFWATQARIPGGTSFENFELEAPFQAGQEFTFGITPEPPEKLGFPATGRK